MATKHFIACCWVFSSRRSVLSIIVCVWVVFGSVMEVQPCFSKDIGRINDVMRMCEG